MFTSLLSALLLLSGYFLTNRKEVCCVCDSIGCGANNDCPSDCGSGEAMSCPQNTCPDMLGCCKINCIRWTNVCQMSECEMAETLRLAENGYSSWNSCPVEAAAHFLNSSCIPCEFRGKPAYLKDKKEYCSKYYVLLGVSCVGDIAIELDCTPCGNTTVYTVSRFAVIC